MPLPAHARMSSGLLSRMGLPATLDGLPVGKVHIAHGTRVQLGDATYERDVATIHKVFEPALGQQLDHPDGSFILDAMIGDNGLNQRWILR